MSYDSDQAMKRAIERLRGIAGALVRLWAPTETVADINDYESRVADKLRRIAADLEAALPPEPTRKP